VSGRRRRKAQRPSFTPRRCDQCTLAYVFPSRTAYQNHLKWAHRLYLAHTGRFVHVDRPDHTRRARAVPPATELWPTPVPSGPVPPRLLLPETVRARPAPLVGMQFPASRALAAWALMGIEAFPLVAEWRSQAASGRDSARPPPAETARRPLSPPAQDVGLDLVAIDASVSQPGTVGIGCAAVGDMGFGRLLDAPVPADLAPLLQPAILSAPRPWLRRQYPRLAPVEVNPPGAEISSPYEIDAPAHWDEQVVEAEASGAFWGRQAVVPDWANMETAPVPDAPRVSGPHSLW